MVYQHPLAYVLGLEGLALLRGWAGDFDREFVEARLAEVRRLLADETLNDHAGVEAVLGDSVTGYRQWASSYDDPGNGCFAADEAVVLPLLAALPAGVALDAGCGTGRYAAQLAQRHQVIGVDSSAEMLEQARARLPEGDFRLGELDRLPVADDSVDLVVTALALSHVPDLGPVLAEFARVLRPGGQLIISDVHHELVFRGSLVHALGPNGEPGLVRTYRHTPGDFLRAALPHGFKVLRCEEPLIRTGDDPPPATPAEVITGDWDVWPWSLMAIVPEASHAAWDIPGVIIWQFELPAAHAAA